MNIEVTQRFHQIKQNHQMFGKVCSNQQQIKNQVKQQEDCHHFMIKNYNPQKSFDRSNISSLDTIIDQLNESRFQQNSIIDILKELQTSILSQPSNKQQKQTLVKIEQKSASKIDIFNNETVFEQGHTKKEQKTMKRQLKNDLYEKNLQMQMKACVQKTTTQRIRQKGQIKLQQDKIKAIHYP